MPFIDLAYQVASRSADHSSIFDHSCRVSQEPNLQKSLHVETEEVGGGESHLLPHPLATSRSLTQLQPGDLDDLGERFCEDNDAFYIEPDVEEDPAGIPGLAPLISFFFSLLFVKKNTF